MIQHYWTILKMDIKPSQEGLLNVVQKVHCRRVASLEQDGKTYTADSYMTMHCEPPDPLSFIPYEQLTFDEVSLWLDSNLNVEQVDALLDVQIENQINPPIIQLPVPWDTTNIPSN